MPGPSAVRGAAENLLNAFGLGYLDEHVVHRSVRQGYSTPINPHMRIFIQEVFGRLRSLEKLDIRFILNVLKGGIVPQQSCLVFRSLEVDREANSGQICTVHEVKPEIFSLAREITHEDEAEGAVYLGHLSRRWDAGRILQLNSAQRITDPFIHMIEK
jgi:hypothetical protein